MKTVVPLTMQRVVTQIASIGAFPSVIPFLISTLGDPNAHVRSLVEQVEDQPALVKTLIAVATRAARVRGGNDVKDVHVAASLLGLRRVREIVTMASVAQYVRALASPVALAEVWACSVACATCSVEVAQRSGQDIRIDLCLIAGLLHNMGQIWLHRFEFSTYEQARRYAQANRVSLEAAQRHVLGIDQREVSGWLALHWGLGGTVTQAVSLFRTEQDAVDDAVCDAVHVGHVLGNALDLAGSRGSQVHALSPASCARLSIDWSQDSHRLFGRMEARYKDAMELTEASPAKGLLA